MDTIMSLNGSVHSQGVKIDVPAWLDMGSKDWQETEARVKAAAYQAAKVCGWTDQGLKSIIVNQFGPRIDQFMEDVTIETLQDMEKEFPVEVEQVYVAKKETPTFKVHSSEATFKMPE